MHAPVRTQESVALEDFDDIIENGPHQRCDLISTRACTHQNWRLCSGVADPHPSERERSCHLSTANLTLVVSVYTITVSELSNALRAGAESEFGVLSFALTATHGFVTGMLAAGFQVPEEKPCSCSWWQFHCLGSGGGGHRRTHHLLRLSIHPCPKSRDGSPWTAPT